MNIYEKLQKCRVELQNSVLQKSGYNKFSDYWYFELADFLPKVNELFFENNLCGIVKYGIEMVTLDIVNIEKPEETIQFTSPMSTAVLKGCNEVQNLGAVETYERRYLYVTALEITESDALDPITGKEELKKKKKLPALSKIRFESFHEGKSAQIMYIGPFSDEGPTIQKIHEFIRKNEGTLTARARFFRRKHKKRQHCARRDQKC